MYPFNPGNLIPALAGIIRKAGEILVLKKSLSGIVFRLFPDPCHPFQQFPFLGKP
jgi:hypothetical protein